MLRVAVVAGLLIASAPALAQEQTTAAAAPKPEKKICRMVTPTGSIMGKRFCLTRSEWKKLGDVNTDNAETMLAARRLTSPKGTDMPQ